LGLTFGGDLPSGGDGGSGSNNLTFFAGVSGGYSNEFNIETFCYSDAPGPCGPVRFLTPMLFTKEDNLFGWGYDFFAYGSAFLAETVLRLRYPKGAGIAAEPL
jgi:hypothetical protein